MTSLVKSVIIFGAASFALSGCMGSSGSGGGAAVTAPAPGSLLGDRAAPDLAAASALATAVLAEDDLDGPDAPRIAALLGDVIDANSAATPEASALSGTASYAGDFAAGEINDGDLGLLGDFALSVNFDDSTLSGSLGNEIIVDGEGPRRVATGSANITGTVDGTGMTATITGVYADRGEAAGIDGVMSGRFAGTHAGTVAGGMALAVGGDGTPTVFEGVFAGQRSAP